MTQRDRLNDSVNSFLQAAADCASALVSDENFERSVNRALEILGTSIDADRLGIGEQHNDSTGNTLGYVVFTYEWQSFGTISQIHHPELNRINSDDFGEDHFKLLSDRYCGGLIETYPEPFRSGQEKLGVKATYAIPIMVRGQYWGFIGLDFCRIARELNEAEIAVLKTAATCIGSAIQRERNRKEKEAAERKSLLQQQKTIELQERDRLLNLTANAAQALLNKENLDKAIANALEIIGEGIATERVAVMEHCDDPTGESLGYLKMLYEWHSIDAVSQLHHPQLHQVSYQGIEDWYEQLTKGEAVGGVVSELAEPIRSGQEEIGVKSTYSVPIAIDGEYWGLIGLDNCKEAKQRNETEISILKTVATCIGSAIAQHRICQSREVAERSALLQQQKAAQLEKHNRVLEQRDRILAATAEASNVLLTGTDFDEAVNKALQIIGETINTDRVAVLEHLEDLSSKSLGFLQVTYEWDSINTISQLNHPEVSRMSYGGVEEWYTLSCQGTSTGGVLDELKEPFRSSMAQIGVKSTYTIPIVVNSQYWGLIGIDDCREATHRSEAELSILKTAAACIGGAIERERTRRAKESAERNILLEREQAAQERAKLLQAVATVANSLLRSPDYRTALPEVLQILGEAAKSDRCSLVENVLDSQTGEAAVKICAEWCRQDIQASIDHTPELENALLWSYFPQFEEELIQGKTSTFLIDELSEPASSILQAQGNISLTLVPIVVQGKFWGVFSFDYCQQARLFAEADTAIFAIAVDSIAAAIEREQQDEALKASEKRYRTLFELSNEGIYRFEFDSPIDVSLPIKEQVDLALQYYRFAEANEAYYAQMGVSNMEKLVQFTLRDFHGNLEQNRQVNLAIVQNGYQIKNAETEETNASGQQKFFLNNIVCDVRKGLVLGGWCMQTDITELKEAQQALLEAEREKARELEESNQILSLRDCWLEATANAANRLLATPNLDAGINAALKVLGESLDCDRLQIWQLIYTPVNDIPKLGRIIYEWKIPNIGSQMSHPNLNEMPVEELGEEWIEQLLNGEWVGGAIDELSEPFRDTEIKLGAKSTYIVPFFLNGTWWGTVSMDFCRKSRILTPAEIAVFKTAASCVGSAIFRQQIQQGKEKAELAILEERNRMAREIHDTLAQAFTGISLQLEAAKNSLTTNSEIATERLLQAKNLAKEGIIEARRSVRALRPEAMELGLSTALRQLVNKMLLGTKIKPEISIEGETRTLTPQLEAELFRIAQEALTNVIRHAQATEILIQLIYEPDTIYLQIKDNGIGFDLQQLQSEGFGLLGMRERCDCLNADLVINSVVGEGTEILIRVASGK